MSINLMSMMQPGYTFNGNDLKYLGSTLYYKLENDREKIQEAFTQELNDNYGTNTNTNTKNELKSLSDNIDSTLKLLNDKDIINYNLIENINIDNLIKELETYNYTNGIKPSDENLKEYVRTMRFIVATHKLLISTRTILESVLELIGVNINDNEIKKYLDNIDKGVEQINKLTEILNNNNIMLTKEQILIILSFLQVYLKIIMICQKL